MEKRQRGSEKLLASCSGASALTREEIEQVTGGSLLSSPLGIAQTGYMNIFPRGIPRPRFFFDGPGPFNH